MSDAPVLRLLLTTLPNEEAAKALVRQLLEERLIACGTLLPGAQSFYWWEGKIEESAEVVVLFKTETQLASRCMERLASLHPYEVPEILLLAPEAGAEPYAAWVRENLRQPVGGWTAEGSPGGARGEGTPEFKL